MYLHLACRKTMHNSPFLFHLAGIINHHPLKKEHWNRQKYCLQFIKLYAFKFEELFMLLHCRKIVSWRILRMKRNRKDYRALLFSMDKKCRYISMS